MTQERLDPSAAPEVVGITTPEKETTITKKIEKTRTRSKSYNLDLRVHSPASLGYLGIDGIDCAPAIVRLARVKGLDLIAVTDFYTGEFIDRIIAAAKDSTLTIIPGVDIRCKMGACDDVILSCLFPETYSTSLIESFLANFKIPVSSKGNKNYIAGVSVRDIVSATEQTGGVVLPSRMDKTPHRMAAIPELVEKYGFRSFDLAYSDTAQFFKRRWPKLKFNLYSFSNANALAQVGSRSARVKMTQPGFAGIKELVARAAE